jgi:hypothetical protein
MIRIELAPVMSSNFDTILVSEALELRVNLSQVNIRNVMVDRTADSRADQFDDSAWAPTARRAIEAKPEILEAERTMFRTAGAAGARW